MDPITYEGLLRNPELLATLQLQARRERAHHIQRLIVAPLLRFFTAHAGRPPIAAPGKTARAA
jgi:hypothetical protein